MPPLQQPSSETKLPLVSPGQTATILILWAIVNTLIYWKHGIFIELEAAKYIGQAKQLMQTGQFESGNFRYYFVQIGLIWLSLKAHLGFTFVYIIQLLFNLLATFYFYRTMILLFDSPKAAFIATLLLLLNLPYQEFNSYLQTESLFQSLTLLFSCYLIRIRQIHARHFLVILPFLCILSITRPVGLFYIPATFLYIFLITREQHGGLKQQGAIKRLLLLFLPAILFLFLLNVAMGSGGELDFLLPFREEHIICGVPTCLSCHTAGGNGNSLQGLLSYIVHDLPNFLKLAALKTAAFWGIYRSYYSTPHNLLVMVGYYPFILAAIGSSRSWWKGTFHERTIWIYLTGLILLTWATVILTCDDWHNRFFLSISPYLLILSVPGIKRIIAKTSR